MTELEAKEFLSNLMFDHDEKRRLGMVDVVKVIVSISAVMLTVLVSLSGDTTPHLSFCSNFLNTLLVLLPYVFLLGCIGISIYHLNYALVNLHKNSIGLVLSALQGCSSPSQAIEKLGKNNSINHPYLYKISIPLIFWLFGLAIVSTCLNIFI